MKKTAFIAIVGRPNVGKSTILNSILKEKISIVSKKPQTTRNRILGIYTQEENQFVFMDTPGIHKPRTKLGNYMVGASNSSLRDADAALLVVEPHEAIGEIEEQIISNMKEKNIPCILVINKIDAFSKINVVKTIEAYSKAYDFTAVIPISAKSGKDIDIVLKECESFLKESVWFFPDDMITDQSERQIVAEVIREKMLRTLNEEIPHGVAVSIEEMKEEKNILKIRAEIFCEKDTHKGIIIGKNGCTLKLISTKSREDLERFFQIKVYLDVWVKVKENWRNSSSLLNNFGYNMGDLQ